MIDRSDTLDLAPGAQGPDRAIGRTPNILIVPMIVAMAFVLEQIDSTIVTIAIPQIARSLGDAPLKMDVLVTAYVISVAVFMPISGWAADRFGSRRVFCCAIAVFTASSAACGVASRLDILVIGRLAQGLGGAMMTPVGRLILLRSFAKRDHFRAMSYMLMPVIIGPSLGPLIGGLIVTHGSWRWIFFINLPLGLLGILAALKFFRVGRSANKARFDFRGFLLTGVGSALFMLAVEAVAHAGQLSWRSVATLLTALIAFGLYGLHARRTADPVLDLSLFKQRTISVGVLSGGLCRLGMNAPTFLLPVVLQLAFGLKPTQTGLLMFASSMGSLSSRMLTKRLLAGLGFGRTLTLNAVAAAVWVAGFALMTPKTPIWLIATYLVGLGALRAIQFNSINTLIYSEVQETALSRATSLAGVAQQLATALGVTVAASLLAAVAGPNRLPTVADFHIVVLIVAAFPLMSLVGFSRLQPADGAEVSGYRTAR